MPEQLGHSILEHNFGVGAAKRARHAPVKLELMVGEHFVAGQRWVIAIETKIQLPNTLPIIFNCAN